MKNRKRPAKTYRTRAIILWIAAALFFIPGSFDLTSLTIAVLLASIGFRSFMHYRWVIKEEKKEQEEKEAYDKYINSIKRVDVNIADTEIPNLAVNNMPELITRTLEIDLQYEKCSDFIVVDIKTTGRDPMQHKILEFAAVKFHDYEPVEYMASLINAESKNETAPIIGKALPSLIGFVGGSDAVVAHNLSYNVEFLYANGFDFFKTEKKYYGTREIAKKYFDLDSYKLETLCGLYSIYYEDNHSALHDCVAIGQLFKELLTDI